MESIGPGSPPPSHSCASILDLTPDGRHMQRRRTPVFAHHHGAKEVGQVQLGEAESEAVEETALGGRARRQSRSWRRGSDLQQRPSHDHSNERD